MYVQFMIQRTEERMQKTSIFSTKILSNTLVERCIQFYDTQQKRIVLTVNKEKDNF